MLVLYGFANFQVTQNHRQKCDMLITLLERNHLSDYIDEAFVFFDLEAQIC